MNKYVVFAAFAIIAILAAAGYADYPNGGIRIYKFKDLNGNGVQDGGEGGMAATFRIAGDNGWSTTVSTGSAGKTYPEVIYVPFGAVYTITETVPNGYEVTTQNPQRVWIKEVLPVNCPYTACARNVFLKFGNKPKVCTTTSTTTTKGTTTTTTTTTRATTTTTTTKITTTTSTTTTKASTTTSTTTTRASTTTSTTTTMPSTTTSTSPTLPSTTSTTSSSTTTTFPEAAEFSSEGALATVLLLAPAFAYLAVKRKQD